MPLWRRRWTRSCSLADEAAGRITSAGLRKIHTPSLNVYSVLITRPRRLTFEGLATNVTAVGAALLVFAGLVADEGAFLREALLTNITAEGALAGVCAVVFV